MGTPDDLGLEHFDDYFAFAPAALALRECVRLAAIRGIDLPEPILDIGCGDGIFARLAYPDRQVWGIDINPIEIRRAQSTASYDTLICGSIIDTDLPPAYFRSAIANCSLEHVPDVMGAFATIHRALVPGAPFVLIVPTPHWTRQLPLPRALETIGLGELATAYREGLDRVFNHVHLYGADRWSAMLDEAGFDVEQVAPIVSPAVTAAFDFLLYPSLAGYVGKALTGRWTLFPALRRRAATLPKRFIEQMAALFPTDASRDPGELVIITRRRQG